MKNIEYIRVCGECHGPIVEEQCGDEGWSVCQYCGQVEGINYEVTAEEWDQMCGDQIEKGGEL
jgi:hypothetical protein